MLPYIDGHLDIAYNALFHDRDQSLDIAQLRAREAALTGSEPGLATVCLPELRRAGAALCMVTVFARAKPGRVLDQPPMRMDLDFGSASIAHAVTRAQLAYYELLESQGMLTIIRDRAALDAHWLNVEAARLAAGPWPLGVILTMEGADAIVEPPLLDDWHARGLRALSLVHYGHNAFAAGTGVDGPLTDRGRTLLKRMRSLPMALDLTHTSDTSMAEAFDLDDGPIYARHSNCRALADTVRQLTDAQLRTIIGRDGVVGVVLYNKMLQWPCDQRVPLDRVVDHIDHICSLAGNTRHVAIGSDLDGGFGALDAPAGIDTIADMQKLAALLASRGFSQNDIEGIFSGNWIRFMRRILPGA